MVAELQVLPEVQFLVVGKFFHCFKCGKVWGEGVANFFLYDWRQKDVSSSLLDHLKEQLHSPASRLELFADAVPVRAVEGAVAVEPHLRLPLFVKSYLFLLRHHWPELELNEVESAEGSAEDGQRLLPIEISQRGQTNRYVLDEELCGVVEGAKIRVLVDKQMVHLHQIVFHRPRRVNIQVATARHASQSHPHCWFPCDPVPPNLHSLFVGLLHPVSFSKLRHQLVVFRGARAVSHSKII